MNWEVLQKGGYLSAFLCIFSLIGEVLSALVMFVYSDIYSSLAENNQNMFWRTISAAIIIVLLQAVVQAMKIFFRLRLALAWRTSLINKLQEKLLYLLELGSSHLKELPIPNLDQRVTQDSTDFTEQTSELLEKFVVIPFCIVYYSFYLIDSFGFIVPLLCFLYFLMGFGISYIISQFILPFVYQQGKLEGDFRFLHTLLMQHWQMIEIQQGGDIELDKTKNQFERLKRNKIQLINRQFLLNWSTQSFAYAGSIVTYAIVGSAIYFTISHRIPNEEIAASSPLVQWSRGSYACLALMNAFTNLTEMLSLWSTANGLAHRILDVFQYHPHSSSSFLHDSSTPAKSFSASSLPNNSTTEIHSRPQDHDRRWDQLGIYHVYQYCTSSLYVLNPTKPAITSRMTSNSRGILQKLVTLHQSSSSQKLPNTITSSQVEMKHHPHPSFTTTSSSSNSSSTSSLVPQEEYYDQLLQELEEEECYHYVPQLPSSSLSSIATDATNNSNISSTIIPINGLDINHIIFECQGHNVYSISNINTQRRLLIENISFQFTNHTKLLITGPTGCGKTSFLQSLIIYLRTHDQYSQRIRVLYLPQVPYILPQVSAFSFIY
jgi:ABC-type uncharacterized transport system fused permease/ATPase subunit